MKEYWVNVYEEISPRNLYQCAKSISREYAAQLSGENRFGYCGKTLYRIHVKMKELKPKYEYVEQPQELSYSKRERLIKQIERTCYD